MNRVIDLSHPIEHGMTTYRGLPGPVIRDFLSREESRGHYDENTTFQIGRIDLVGNTGTYIDAPFHRHAGGADIAGLSLASVADVPGVVVRIDPEVRSIGPQYLEGLDAGGRAVLFHTGWSRHWGTERYFEGHPFLTAEAAEFLAAAGVVLAGIDSLNIDDNTGGERPVHTILLGAGIPIVEHLCRLESLPDTGFRFHAVPAPVRSMTSFPVRAYGVIDSVRE